MARLFLSFLFFLLFSGCSADADRAFNLETGTSPLEVDTIELLIPDFSPGVAGVIVITGAIPNERIVIYRGVPGAGPCPGSDPWPFCFGIVDPMRWISGFADETGTFTREITFPDYAPIGREICLQALGHREGFSLSTVECGVILDCNGTLDGDAFFDECGDCVGGSTGLPPCDLSCVSMPYVEMAEGNVWIPTSCAPGDYDCQAEAVCEWVTGTDCVYQSYDCGTAVSGSYYPLGTPGGDIFNFAVTYDFVGSVIEEGGEYGGYGNICACDMSFCELYGLACPHTWCGSGHWGLDADGAECP